MSDQNTKGLSCYVYRHNLGDATLGGYSAAHDSILVLGIEGPETIEDAAALGRPVFVLDRSDPNYLRIIPYGAEAAGAWMAWGGNFVFACDSRFTKVSRHPIAIYDRDMHKEW